MHTYINTAIQQAMYFSIGDRSSTPDFSDETTNDSVELRTASSPINDSALNSHLTSPEVAESDMPSPSISLDLTCGSDILTTVSDDCLNEDVDDNDNDDDDVSSSDCSPDVTDDQIFNFSLSSEPFNSESDISLCAAICAVMEFCMNNKSTYNAIADLLKLLQLLCPSPNKLPKSVYQLKKMFSNINSSSCEQIKMCTSCAESAETCQCLKPNIGNIVTTSINKPLEAIVTSKLCNFVVCL